MRRPQYQKPAEAKIFLRETKSKFAMKCYERNALTFSYLAIYINYHTDNKEGYPLQI